MNVELVAELYTENGNYPASGNTIIDGRVKIRESFTMEFKFQILQREVYKKTDHEVGIYTLNTFKDDKRVKSEQRIKIKEQSASRTCPSIPKIILSGYLV